MQYYAHSKDGAPTDEWQTLQKHLRKVAKRSRKLAEKFHAGNWGHIAGLMHDVGKYSPEFQAYLRRENGIDDPDFRPFCHGKTRHAIQGARHLVKTGPKFPATLLAYLVAGHHRGLQDGSGSGDCSLKTQLDPERDRGRVPNAELPSWLSDEVELPTIPPIQTSKDQVERKRRGGFQVAMFTRMLYSCLVDADSLDTERFVDRDVYESRRGYPDLNELAERFRQSMSQLTEKVKKSVVNLIRDEIHDHCIAAAKYPPGFFSLTVPTGGGKTLSSLAFALEHAKKHGLQRVIYTIPFTSIIEQNAQVFRNFLGKDAVLEHHCNFDPDKVYDQQEEENVGPHAQRAKLATENWDAPLIVTTNVQLFNSLMSNRRSRCRKLHNLCRSVIVLDEAQALPPEHLTPCIEALRELAMNYGCSIVLCTATQPALEKNEEFPDGLDGVREIIPEPEQYFDRLKRVEIKLCDSMLSGNDPLTDEVLCERLADHPQVLVVVNTRKHARVLFERLREQQAEDNRTVFHLSAAMCPVHRTEQLDAIKKRLKDNLPCQVISTQLIEAGVDIDFPAVYRAETGIDSLAQSAGRCNREGRLNAEGRLGQVTLFKSEHGLPIMGGFQQRAHYADGTIDHYGNNLLTPKAVEDYFTRYYWNCANKDSSSIIKHCGKSSLHPFYIKFDIRFEEMGKFSLIRDDSRGVCIPLNREAKQLIEKLRYAGPNCNLMRKLQQFTVSVYEYYFSKLVSSGVVEELHGCFVLQQEKYYSPFFGLEPKLALDLDPGAFFVGD